MSDVDAVPMRPLDPPDAAIDPGSPSFTDSAHHSRKKPFSRDVAMKRDRSRDSRDGSRGRGRPQQTRRGHVPSAQTRLRSSSPGSRPSQNHRAREKKYYGGEAYHDDSERRVDERRQSASSDHRDHHFDETPSDMMHLLHQDIILSPMIIRNIPGTVHFLRPLESGPEAEVRCRSPPLDPKDPSVNANATAAVVRKERNDLIGIILKGMGHRGPIVSPLLVGVPSPHITMLPTAATPNEAIIQTKLVPVIAVDHHLGRLIPMNAPRSRLVHVSTLKFEISVVPHGLPPAVPHSHTLIPPLAQSDGHHLEAPRILVRILAGRPLLLSRQESIMHIARLKIAALVVLRCRSRQGTLAQDSLTIFRRDQHPSRLGQIRRILTLQPRLGLMRRLDQIKVAIPNIKLEVSTCREIEIFLFPLVLEDVKGRANRLPVLRRVLWPKLILVVWPTSSSSNRGVLSSPSNALPVRSGTPNAKDEDEEAQNTAQPPDNHPEEILKDEKAVTDQTPSPRPPPTAPTGPANSKFSFAFKTSNKNPVATPKPEISQKFSAAPKKEPPPIIDDRDRDLPKDTPREPASARARADYHHSRAQPPEQPRTRKVIKTRRKLKPKPPLEPELARSISVYFRKPGNESVVGSGTYGKVFKGKHVYTKKLVALKRIRMEGERDGFPVTAMREVKLLQSLRHPNIVDLHEMMIERNECYMVFEYLSHDLTGLLNHPTYKLDASQKKHLAMQLFEGLDYLHKRGVLHRDIKAANILVSSDGILKLADFGLARFYAKRHQLDYTNRVITIWYRSPELLLGETQYGAAVDIWSAACVMVEIFTRHAIFPGDGGEISQLEKIYNILGTPNRKEWPGLADTPWFELLRPSYRKPNVFADKYRERLPAAAFNLLEDMFQYDPIKRPSAANVLEHPYFTIEQPPPRQAVELKDIKGDWHEFESKALRREKEKQEKQQREARRAAAAKDGGHDKERKRPPSVPETQPESKRPHLEGQASNLSQEQSSTALPPATETVAE
ncbi:hypothetical protein EKO27_g10950 [Xylaria grammica]|uniref:cyclin-dependent kinase n=1 Tax=Xylaria grammica TaxID=363999 RepID=A0A439CPT9_9PEZI|nr:hypothetical protein EKO27_g10950 [Xylaria grammica]